MRKSPWLQLSVFSLCWLVVGHPARAEEPQNQVVITASRLGNNGGMWQERIQVVTRRDLDAWATSSLADVLGRLTSLDVQRRGPGQADLSLRGSGFEQVLVLVDGVAVNDPQTGHHNLDLPLCTDDIERIEVLPGVGSAVHGPGAYSGIVNVVTRQGVRGPTVVRAAGGSHAALSSSLSVATGARTDPFATRVSAGLDQTSGHRPGTDARKLVASTGALIDHPGGITRARVGFMDKRFGADGFYGPYPSWETTRTWMALASSTLNASEQIEILPVLSLRQHQDSFLLDRDNPDGYSADHQTRNLGAELALRWRDTALGDWVFGLGHHDQKMQSSTLGDHGRYRSGLFAENGFRPIDGLRVNWGVRFDWGTSAGANRFSLLSPSLTVQLAPTKDVSILLSAGRGFRQPSFTELYYSSPANQGQPALRVEENWAFDLTVNWRALDDWTLGASAFVKSDSGLVDWVKNADDDPWQATNLGQSLALGGQGFVRYSPHQDFLAEVAYTRLELQAQSDPPISKYVFRQPIDDAWLRLRARLWGITGSLATRYRRRPGDPGAVLIDAALSKRIHEWVELHLQAVNLLDAREEEIPGAPLAGLTVSGGAALFW